MRLSVCRGEDLLRGHPGPIDFLYLDGGDDPAEALAEFEAALPRLSESAVVAIDDCHPYGGNELGKGTALIPRARELGWQVEIETSLLPFRTAIITRHAELGR